MQFDDIFTARCYAERDYATVYCLSVRLSVTLRYVFHTGWNTSKIISRPNSFFYRAMQFSAKCGIAIVYYIVRPSVCL